MDQPGQQLIQPQCTYQRFKASAQHLLYRLMCRGAVRSATAGKECRVRGGEEESKPVTVHTSGNAGTHSASSGPLSDAQDPTLTHIVPSLSTSSTMTPHHHFHYLGVNPPQGRDPLEPSRPPTPQPPRQNMFQDAQRTNISGGAFTNVGRDNIVNNYGGAHGLEKIESFVSFSARHDSSAQDPGRRCHPGTRRNVLTRMQDWIDNPNTPERIFWLHGPAGAGKSAIAQTIAQSYTQPKVAATFFFYRSDDSRNDGNRLFTTLAYQLAYSMPAIKDHVALSLHKRPDLPLANVETQFDQLIGEPFRALVKAASEMLVPIDIVDDIHNDLLSFPVVIIDGIDECTDEKLQRRFLKVIGNAVKDTGIPLRFLICSRPEAHIEETLDSFQPPILRSDLAKLEDANRDIEKYLIDEFIRIATKQRLGPTWPGQEIIDDIVFKSSGNFIYAATIIRFVGDEDNSAKSQLDIVRSIRPPKTMLPFSTLDELYLEILRRQPDQDFLKKFLVLLVARIAASSKHRDLHKDDAVLMHVSEEELHIKLRKMRSLLKFEPHIGLHHQSFLDFLRASSRSCEYHVDKRDGMTGYLEVFIDSLVLYVSNMVEKRNYHSTCHFSPEFGDFICFDPRKFWQSVPEWQEALEPLLHLQDTLLKLSNFASIWKLQPCKECNFSNVMRNLLLHLAFHRGATYAFPAEMAEAPGAFNDDLDTSLSSLLTRVRAMKSEPPNEPPNAVVINEMCSILQYFDPAATAMRVRSVSDAQELVDFISYLNDEKNNNSQYNPDMVRKASHLALKIFARVPILPRSLFSSGSNCPPQIPHYDRVMDFQLLCQTAFACKTLDHDHISPVLTIEKRKGYFRLFYRNDMNTEESFMAWRSRSKPSTTIPIILKIAKCIQYFHSMNVVLHRTFGPRNIFLDSESRPRVHCFLSILQDFSDKGGKEWFSYEANMFSFGCLFYEVYFMIYIDPSKSIESKRHIIMKRPHEPEIPEYAWKLIQHCCAADPRGRPTIDEVVRQMES